MLKIQNLTKSYGDHLLIADATFNVNRGERIGLVGRNGHGKTTLFRLIVGEESPDSGTISSSKGYRTGYLRQALDFTRPSILEEVATGLREEDQDQVWKAEKVLAGLGFDTGDLIRSPSEFSGGYQVRLNLAKLLVSEPDLLLLDEPTNFLDIVAIRWLERYLNTWRGEVLVITHDRSFMDSVTTHTMGIHRQRIRKIKGDTGKYYDQIAMEEEVHEKSRINIERKRQQTEEFIRKFRAKARLVGLVQSRIRTLEKIEAPEKLIKIPKLSFSFRSEPFAPKIMMDVDGVTFSYSGSSPYLMEGLRLNVGRGDRIGVVGANGKGKSTLLRILAGELRPLAGQIKIHPKMKPGYYGQTNVDRLIGNRTVVEEIQSTDPERSHQRARTVAGRMMFEGDHGLKRISVLSGGERSRVLLGKLLLEPHNLLLLDEPTNHLDMESSEALLAALEGFDGAVIIVTHNEKFLHTLAQRLIVFDKGMVTLFDGTYRDFLDETGWQAEEGLPNDGRPGRGIVKAKARKNKVARQQRARLIQDRTRQLKPLQDKADEMESTIQDLEVRFETVNSRLVEAANAQDADRIAELSRESRSLTDQIESSYRELFTITEELEELQEHWAGRLSGSDS